MLTILHTYSGACSVQCKANIYFLWCIKSGLFTAILLFSRSSIFYLYSVMTVTDGHLNGPAGWLGEASGRWLGGIILIMSDKLSGASLRIISWHDHGPPAPAAAWTRTWVNQRRFCSHVAGSWGWSRLCPSWASNVINLKSIFILFVNLPLHDIFIPVFPHISHCW